MANVLFGWKPEWRPGLETALARGGHTVTMAPLGTTDPSPFDAVVPLDIADQARLDRHRAAGRTVPGLWPTRAARRLCDDKLNLNQALAQAGFGAHVPRLHRRPPRDPAAYPLILKSRRGASGQGCVILHSRPEARQHRDRYRAETHFLQDYVVGADEGATHLLMRGGACVFAATAIYHTGRDPVVRGTANRFPVAEWLTDHTPHLDLMLAILAVVGFADGLCAVNWRETDAGPMLFEINPRVGASLVGRADLVLLVYLAAVSAPE